MKLLILGAIIAYLICAVISIHTLLYIFQVEDLSTREKVIGTTIIVIFSPIIIAWSIFLIATEKYRRVK